SRYAAADLATAVSRGRSLATVVRAPTVGTALGPNLSQPMGDLAEAVGVPRLACPCMLPTAAFVLSAVLLATRLAPEPPTTARAEAARRSGVATPAPPGKSIRTVLRGIASVPPALTGLWVMASGHAVMVGVMSMTPVHLHHGDASL